MATDGYGSDSTFCEDLETSADFTSALKNSFYSLYQQPSKPRHYKPQLKTTNVTNYFDSIESRENVGATCANENSKRTPGSLDIIESSQTVDVIQPLAILNEHCYANVLPVPLQPIRSKTRKCKTIKNNCKKATQISKQQQELGFKTLSLRRRDITFLCSDNPISGRTIKKLKLFSTTKKQNKETDRPIDEDNLSTQENELTNKPELLEFNSFLTDTRLLNNVITSEVGLQNNDLQGNKRINEYSQSLSQTEMMTSASATSNELTEISFNPTVNQNSLPLQETQNTISVTNYFDSIKFTDSFGITCLNENSQHVHDPADSVKSPQYATSMQTIENNLANTLQSNCSILEPKTSKPNCNKNIKLKQELPCLFKKPQERRIKIFDKSQGRSSPRIKKIKQSKEVIKAPSETIKKKQNRRISNPINIENSESTEFNISQTNPLYVNAITESEMEVECNLLTGSESVSEIKEVSGKTQKQKKITVSSTDDENSLPVQENESTCNYESLVFGSPQTDPHLDNINPLQAGKEMPIEPINNCSQSQTEALPCFKATDWNTQNSQNEPSASCSKTENCTPNEVKQLKFYNELPETISQDHLGQATVALLETFETQFQKFIHLGDSYNVQDTKRKKPAGKATSKSKRKKGVNKSQPSILKYFSSSEANIENYPLGVERISLEEAVSCVDKCKLSFLAALEAKKEEMLAIRKANEGNRFISFDDTSTSQTFQLSVEARNRNMQSLNAIAQTFIKLHKSFQ